MVSVRAAFRSLYRLQRTTGLAVLAAVLVMAGCARSTSTPPPTRAEAGGQPASPAQSQPAGQAAGMAPAAPATAAPTTGATPATGNTPAAQPLTPAGWPADALDVAWSPDSAHLAVLTEDGLQIWDISTRKHWTWPAAIPQDSTLVGWRADGLAIYVQTPQAALLEVDAAGKSMELSGPQQLEPQQVRYVASPAGPMVVRAWTGRLGGKFQLIGYSGAAPGSWEGLFMNWSPSGRYLAYNAGKSTSLVNLQTGKETALPYLATPVWQGAGERFFLLAASTLHVMDVSGKVLTTLPGVRQATWSADGTRILFTDAEAIWTVNVDGSNRQLLTRADLGTVQRQIVWLAQDELVYMTVGKTGGGGTAFYPRLIDDGKVTDLSAGTNGTRPDLYVSPDRRHVAYIVGPPSPQVPGDVVIYPKP